MVTLKKRSARIFFTSFPYNTVPRTSLKAEGEVLGMRFFAQGSVENRASQTPSILSTALFSFARVPEKENQAVGCKRQDTFTMFNTKLLEKFKNARSSPGDVSPSGRIDVSDSGFESP